MSKLAINKKRTNISFVLKIIFIVLLFIFISWISIINLKFVNLAKFVEIFSNKYDYILKEVTINNLKNISKTDIDQYFKPYVNKSIFLIPIDEISKNIKKNNWVKSLTIHNDLNNKIIIHIEESTPIGIYYNGKNYLLINELGRVIDFAKNKDKNKYIIFEGHNAINQAIHLLNAIPEKLKQQIIKAHYIKNRRWDIYTKGMLKIKLPEFEYEKAMKNFVEIQNDLYTSNIVNIDSVDLRIPEKAIIMFKNENS